MTRHTFGAILEAFLIVALIAGLVFGFAVATGRLPVGAHNALAATRTGYAPDLHTSMDGSRAAAATTTTWYTIYGCGYKSAYGMVTITVQTPVGLGWTGRMPDGDGCISVDNYYTMGPGTYSIKA